MMKMKMMIVFVVAFYLSISIASPITTLALDNQRSKIYASQSISSCNLYEIDMDTESETAVHFISNSVCPTTGSIVAKEGLHQYLFIVTNDLNADNSYLSKYHLPLSSGNLNPLQTVLIGGGDAEVLTFDKTDNIGVFINARNISYVNLCSMTLGDSLKFITGYRGTASAVIYNHNTDHITVFYTDVVNGQNGAVYILTTYEFDIVDDKIVATASSFTNPDPENGPFKRTILADGKIDYNNHKAWFLDVQNGRLVSFRLHNLNNYAFINLPSGVSFDANVAYDFGSQIAYVVGYTDATTIVLYEVDLVGMSIRRTKNYTAGHVDYVVLNQDGDLYLGFEDTSDTMVGVINLGNLDLTKITLV